MFSYILGCQERGTRCAARLDPSDQDLNPASADHQPIESLREVSLTPRSTSALKAAGPTTSTNPRRPGADEIAWASVPNEPDLLHSDLRQYKGDPEQDRGDDDS